ncbi:plasmid mobilization protein [Eubacterium coprostanoligenes]|uniref:plasmid mobilization protein n=1 Tax=Eubacterium coprostanoligenes TaxID=290054 RepID=UPI002356885B|nr:plasmid mobilization relaxosome protein MobC [Eubacterium coprostanoligenes]MCI6254222.1 MobC family plasmid mobilization relaxosome protein [Eubacterium coprostanoligenes]MDY5399688.1 plasmid mobilization relaxosome protein MobC [Eubacterium coprostanoligenes]
MNKRIKKQFWLSPKDAEELKRKAELVGLTETAVVRLLIRGYEPREKPDGRFYDAMRNLSAIGNNINQLAAKAHTLGFIDVPMLKNEANRWHRFQADIEATFLRPAESKFKWK